MIEPVLTEISQSVLAKRYLIRNASQEVIETPKALFQRVPMKEIAQPEWIASGVVFLASDDSRYMTGQVLVLDGGYVMDGSLPGAAYWEE